MVLNDGLNTDKIIRRSWALEEYILDLYGRNIETVLLGEDGERFIIENETGKGIITSYKLYTGLYVTFNDIHMEYYTDNSKNAKNILEINHCREGRTEANFKGNRIGFLSPGDLAAAEVDLIENTVYFPTGHYHGVSLLIDLENVNKNEIFAQFNIDFKKIKKLANKEDIKIFRSNERLEHIFYEFYRGESEFIRNYLKVKVLELLLFITHINWNKEERAAAFMNKAQADKIKGIRNLIVNNLDKRFTIKELAKKSDFSMTTLKTYFKALYGESIYAYSKRIKLEKSRILLIQNRLSVAQTALEVGYENPAKFSSAFKKEYGISPSKFIVRMDK